MPAMLVMTPKETTTRQSTRTPLMKAGLAEMRLAHISLKDMKPSRQVKANNPKQTLTRVVTRSYSRPLPPVRAPQEARNFSSCPSWNQASACWPPAIHTRPMMTTKPVRVQMTMVSRKTPRACTQPCSQGWSTSAAAAGMVMVP